MRWSVIKRSVLQSKLERSHFAEPSSETLVAVIDLFLFVLYWLKSGLLVNNHRGSYKTYGGDRLQ